MQIQFHTHGQTLPPSLRDYTDSCIRRGLGRYAHRVRLVRVYLWNGSGPRASRESGVRLVVELFPAGEVLVRDAARNPYLAVAGAVSRARSAVRDEIERRRVRLRRFVSAERAITNASSSAAARRRDSSLQIPERPEGESMTIKTIVLTEPDRAKLQRLVTASLPYAYANRSELEALEAELQRARVVPASAVPPDVVTMNSRFRLKNVDSDTEETYTLVFPPFADPAEGRLSVLAPVGTAVLGYRVGDVVRWSLPEGHRRLRVEELLFQPERDGCFSL